MVMVASVDGKTTRGNESNIHSWTSKEDATMFASLIEKNALIVMGSKTYEASCHRMQLKPGKLRVVLTRKPEKYTHDAVKGSLEFTSENPKELVDRLSDQGYKTMLLAGGATVNAQFLKARLVNEIWLTIEPVVLGVGNGLSEGEALDVNLQLHKVRKLNKQGSLQLQYRVPQR